MSEPVTAESRGEDATKDEDQSGAADHDGNDDDDDDDNDAERGAMCYLSVSKCQTCC